MSIEEAPQLESEYTAEASNFRRLYAQFNREIIQKMKERGLSTNEEPYNLDEVVRFVRDESARNTEMEAGNRDAYKAQIFSEWLENQ